MHEIVQQFTNELLLKKNHDTSDTQLSSLAGHSVTVVGVGSLSF